MDAPEVSWEIFSSALDEIRMVNRLLGGTRALRLMLRHFHPGAGKTLSLLDVGTGAADIPAALCRDARRKGFILHAAALDFSGHALRYAQTLHSGSNLPLFFIRGDAGRLPFRERNFDVVTASMFLHHFPAPDTALLLREMWRVSRKGIIVNDLFRGRVPYWSIRALAACVSRSPMVRRDAPASVLNGFRKEDAVRLSALSGVPLRVRRIFPYRFMLWACKHV